MREGIQDISGLTEAFFASTESIQGDIEDALASGDHHSRHAELQEIRGEVEGFNEEICALTAELLDLACSDMPARDPVTSTEAAEVRVAAEAPLINLEDLKRDSECIVCKIANRRTFYQCFEGHIICDVCSQDISSCPMNCGYRYDRSSMIRCRLAERLAEYYDAECPESP